MAKQKRARSDRPRSRGKKHPGRATGISDKRPYLASVVSETGKGILLRVTMPDGSEVEVWQPRAAVAPLADGQWLISQAAFEAKAEAAVETSKADAAFGKDMLPVLGGEIIGQTPKAYRVRLLVSWGSGEPQEWRGFVPMTQAAIMGPDNRLCLSRWIISQKQDEIAQAVENRRTSPVPKESGGFRPDGWGKPELFIGKPIIEIDSEALAAAIRGDSSSPSQSTPERPATPAKASGEPGRLF